MYYSLCLARCLRVLLVVTQLHAHSGPQASRASSEIPKAPETDNEFLSEAREHQGHEPYDLLKGGGHLFPTIHHAPVGNPLPYAFLLEYCFYFVVTRMRHRSHSDKTLQQINAVLQPSHEMAISSRPCW